MAGFKKVSGRDAGNIKVYALSTCGWCKKTKAFLNDHNIGYAYVDVDTLSEDERETVRKEHMRHNPNGSFPTIVINDDKCIVGYDEDALEELVED